MHTPPSRKIDLDALVLGGGVAGLWTLDALVRAGHNAALVESSALGDGQSICAQGILHGGLKYSIGDVLSGGPGWVKEMPARWERCLSGADDPDLSKVRVRSDTCHLWRTESLKSIVGMVGAKVALQVRPIQLTREQRPDVLQGCPGDVAALPETVIETPSLLETLAAAHHGRIIQGRLRRSEDNGGDSENAWLDIALADATCVLVNARWIVLAAGAGTPKILDTLHVSRNMFNMQRRPLHMTMVQGPPGQLPELNGHCVDGSKTRVTITSSTMLDGNRVWQMGGELAETGCDRTPEQQCAEARDCLGDVLPDFDPNAHELAWATYQIDRAEPAEYQAGTRDAFASLHKRIVVTWPTKMVLAPRAADRVVELLGPGEGAGDPPFPDIPVPDVALPPWERAEWS